MLEWRPQYTDDAGFLMQVGVRVEEEDMLTGARHHCCSAYLTFVSVMARPGPGRAAKPLPKTTPGTQHQQEIFRAGEQTLPHACLQHPVYVACACYSKLTSFVPNALRQMQDEHAHVSEQL